MAEPRTHRAAALVRARSVLASSTLTAFTTGGLFLVSGSLGVLLATQMPPGRGSVDVVYGLSLTAALIGLGLILWGRQLRTIHHHVLVTAGTIMLTLAVFASTTPVAAVSLATLYVSVAIDACVFFTWRQAAVHMTFAVVCCMVAIALFPGLPWWSSWVAAGATVGVGVAVGLLSRSASDSYIDAMTGLPNRRGFDRALNREIARATRTGGTGPALILFNLDRFHAINDMHGYLAGDEVLQQVIRSWTALLEPDHCLARYGGDGFAALLSETREDVAVALADRLRTSISLGCSAGVTTWQPGESASFLISRADVGLYRAKLTGGNRTVLESSRLPPLAIELAEAIANGALDVLYQPIVDLTDGAAMIGVEALVRWGSEMTRPDVTTAEVIRIAEEFGLIADLDRYVLRRACLDAHAFPKEGNDPLVTLNVNVSGLELVAPDYVAGVDQILRETGWPPEQLVLEVTESVLDVDTPVAIAALHDLRDRGIRIAIDDFGTGYSSLSRIESLPVDFLKLDKTFFATSTADSPTSPLLRVIATLGAELGLRVIVEGVENECQAETVTSLGYSLAQGYYFGRPQPYAAILEVLNRSHQRQR